MRYVGLSSASTLHDGRTKKNAAEYAAFLLEAALPIYLPGFLKYLKNSEFVSITITSPWSLKLAR